MVELLMGLAQISPIIAVMVAIVLWFKAQYKKKEAEIIKLNDEIKEGNKENLNILYKTLSFFEKLDNTQNNNHLIIMKEISDMRNDLKEKINNMK